MVIGTWLDWGNEEASPHNYPAGKSQIALNTPFSFKIDN
jgi:hypothetical protein